MDTKEKPSTTVNWRKLMIEDHVRSIEVAKQTPSEVLEAIRSKVDCLLATGKVA